MRNYFNDSRNITQVVIVSIALASLILISIASFILNEVIKQHDEEMIKVIASDVYSDISAKLRQAITVSRSMANDTLLIQNLQDAENFSEEEETRIIQNYLNVLREHFDFSAGFLVSARSMNDYTALGLQKKLDLENDPHDVWYKDFLNQNVDYSFNIDTDEANNLATTIFVNTRMLDKNGKIVGVCGVGVGMDDIQKILEQNENEYGIKINLIDSNRLVKVDTDSKKIESSILTGIDVSNKTGEYITQKTKNGYTVTRYIAPFDWYLVINRHSVNARSTLSNLVMYMFVGFLILLAIMLSFIQMRLDRAQKKLEESAKKHGIASHAALYVSMHLIDLKSNSIYELSQDRDVNLFKCSDGTNANVRIIQAVKKMTAKESLHDMVEFTNFATLANRLKNTPAITHEFLSEQYGYCKAYFMRADDEQIIFALEIIDEAKRREKHLLYLSATDAMTGLRNRGSGEKAINELLSRGTEGMFCLLDADKFKSINDNFGHDVGDKVIIAIADCLKRAFRNNDITLRLGGDEFAAFGVGITEEEYARVMIDRLFDLIDQINIPELGERKISISLGASFFRASDDLTFEELYKRADSATYESKRVNGNFATFYHK